MGTFALVLGLAGGMCAIIGIVTSVAALPEFAELHDLFWFALAGILLLGCIAVTIGRTQQY